MTTSEWIINIALLAVVVRQLRGSKIDAKFVLVPVVLVGVSVKSYLTDVPTGGNDLVMLGLFLAVGALLGLAGGLTTKVLRTGEGIVAKATLTAAAIWTVSMASRIVFVEWATHGGAPSIARFSVEHQITGDQVWVAAFLAMVVGEVGVRLATIVLRGRSLAQSSYALAA